MTKYKKYNQASLLLHAVIDNLDNSHFTYDEGDGMLRFNVGKVSRNSSFSHINIIVRRSENEKYIKPAKLTDGSGYAVVIKDPNFPAIKDVDEFLESSERSLETIKALAEIIRVAPGTDSNASPDSKTEYEKEQFYNTREKFESMYQAGVKKMKEKLASLKNSIDELEKKIESTGISSRKVTYKMAIQNLKEEAMGKNVGQFKSIFMKTLDEIDPQFSEHLDAENRKRLNSRIEQFYSELS